MIAETSPTAFAVSLGDPAGVGPEVLAKAWDARVAEALPPFFAVGPVDAITAVWAGPVRAISDVTTAVAVFDEALPVLHLEDSADPTPGIPTLEGAQSALAALTTATGLVRTGGAAGLITGPVSKHQLYQVGYSFPGQTEYVAEACGVSRANATMMLAGPGLRVVPITIHVALADVPRLLTVELIKARAQATHKGLRRDFGIEKPRLAICGLNPHAGENGAIGREEVDIIAPAVAELQAAGIDIVGPMPADTMFAPHIRQTFDAALCPTHDQALIPLKALYFDEGVNLTLGLPIVRTSPDHGTAFALAGRNMANPGAMIHAIRLARQIVENRAACDAGDCLSGDSATASIIPA